jgi:hypothetical protein
MTLWSLALFLSLPAAAADNDLANWIAEYKELLPAHKEDQYTANWRRDIDPIVKKLDDNPNSLPIRSVSRQFATKAILAVGVGCRKGEDGATAERKFQLRTECLWHALVSYDKDKPGAAYKQINAFKNLDDDVADTAQSFLDAVDAYKEIDGKSVNYRDPGGNDEGVLERAVATGNGQFAPSDVTYALKSALETELQSDRGRKPQENDCKGKLTLAEVFYMALKESDGSMPVAAGAISGVLFYNRPLASCVHGLKGSSVEFKDYYRFAGLYIGLQENGVKRVASSTLAQVQTGVYGAIRQVQYTVKGEPMAGTERAGFFTKFPEYKVGTNAADKIRGKSPPPSQGI